jgi:hypothetical protein
VSSGKRKHRRPTPPGQPRVTVNVCKGGTINIWRTANSPSGPPRAPRDWTVWLGVVASVVTIGSIASPFLGTAARQSPVAVVPRPAAQRTGHVVVIARVTPDWPGTSNSKISVSGVEFTYAVAAPNAPSYK